jgi:hypothetical protein
VDWIQLVRELLDQLSDYELLKEDYAPWIWLNSSVIM